MSNINEIMLTREDSYIFHQVGVIPLHPIVRQKFEENNNCLDYTLINESLDGALEWLYQDIISYPELGNELQKGYGLLQHNNGRETKDIEIINNWLNKGEHSYFQEVKGLRYTTDDCDNFPIRGLKLVDSGIYIGQNPTIIQYDKVLIFKNTYNFFAKDRQIAKEVMDSYNIKEFSSGFTVPGYWYVKDGQNLVKLFGKNFAINYTNKLLEKENLLRF